MKSKIFIFYIVFSAIAISVHADLAVDQGSSWIFVQEEAQSGSSSNSIEFLIKGDNFYRTGHYTEAFVNGNSKIPSYGNEISPGILKTFPFCCSGLIMHLGSI